MPYSDELKVYWLFPKRTASRSCMAICKFFNFKDTELHTLEPPLNSDYEFISNVRNPYSRLLSIYELFCHHNQIETNSFKSWVMGNYDKIYYQIDLNVTFSELNRFPNNFIRMEFLLDDLNKLSFIKEEKSEEFKKLLDDNIQVNKYRSDIFTKPWQEYYDEELAECVYNSLKKDFNIFGYDKNSWKNGTS